MSVVNPQTITPDVPLWHVRGDTQTAEYVVTLGVKANIDAALTHTRQLMQQHNLAINATASTNSKQYAQLHFTSDCEQAWQLFKTLLEALHDADLAVQPASWQPKKLLICDMDKTIVDAETLDEVAEQMGIGQQVAQITEQAMRGEIDFHGALRERVKLLSGQAEQVFYDVLAATPVNPGAKELVAQANAKGMTTILISGGFEQVAKPIAERLGFNAVYCNRLQVSDGHLSGDVIEPIVDGAFKRSTLLEYMDTLSLQPQDCCAIGDGANDIPMLQTAGLGIAFQGKPKTLQATPYRISHTDLAMGLAFMGLTE